MSSVKEHCCGADSIFDYKSAQKQYKQYLKKGPARVTSKIIDQLSNADTQGKSMIDIGGGIGALQWWFLKQGGVKTTAVDASSGYLKIVNEHINKNKLEDKTSTIMGDFANEEIEVEQSEFITLDKVVCCYPNYEQILTKVCNSSKEYISLSYPMDGIISKVLEFVGSIVIKLKTRHFRPYVHSVKNIRQLINEKGFERIEHNLVFPWHVETYRRVL